MDRSLISKKILDVMKRQPGRPFKPRALFRKAQLSEKEYGAVKSILDGLFREGRIYRRGRNLYSYRSDGGKLTGRLIITQRGFGFVEVEGRDQDIFIPERQLRNALNGDTVRVEVFRRGQKRQEEGRIKEVVQRNRTEFVGVYSVDRYGEWVVPDDPRTRCRFTLQNNPALRPRPGQIVSIELLHWYDHESEPVGRLLEILGDPGDPGLDILKIIREHDLPVKWEEEALKQVEAYSEETIQAEIPHRLDLRKTPCFTIDPEDAKDFDDAVSLEKTERGWDLGVHIADVSFFVTPHSPVDRGARERGTSVYLVGEAIHMLPEKLSSNLCSLVPGRDRLAMSCLMKLDPHGQVKKVQIAPTVIRSAQRFSYARVQAILDGKKHPHQKRLRWMRDLHRILRERRKSDGSVDLDIPEPVFTLNEQGLPMEIHASQRFESHMLIEEFMLLANRCVADDLRKQEEQRHWPGLYRTHASPQPEDIQKFRSVLTQLKIPSPNTNVFKPKDFQRIVEAVRESPYRYFIERLALRSMTKARYSTENIGHFGLAFPWYTHFTSPIRRYPDLVVHRLLKLYHMPGKAFQPPSREKLQETAVRCSRQEERAVSAERAHLKLKQLQYLAQHVGEEYTGVISGVIGAGFFVELAETLVEGLVPMATLHDDWYVLHEDEYALIGERTGRKFRLGDVVEIRVAAVSVEEGFADFHLMQPRTESKKSQQPGRKRKGK